MIHIIFKIKNILIQSILFYSDNDIRSRFFPIFKMVYQNISPSDCIFDIGSNVGDVTNMFRNYYPENRIYLAEPLELNYNRTKNRFKSYKNIISVNTAICKTWRYFFTKN